LVRQKLLAPHGGTRNSSPDPSRHSSRRADPLARGSGESGHAGDHLGREAQDLLHRIESAATTEQADAAGKAFRAWAEAEGLLLIPPEDGTPTPP
jgi:hypothetical protein